MERATPRLRPVAAWFVLVVAAGCTLSGPGADGWSRLYLRTFDRVWLAALDTAVNEGYLIESEDRERGRIEAEASAARRGDLLLLEVIVTEVSDGVRVDVQARPGPTDGPAGMGRMESTVRSFLLALDQELRVAAPAGASAGAHPVVP